MNRADPRWRKAKNWTARCAHAFPGIPATASIDNYRLSCVEMNGKQRFHGWYVWDRRNGHAHL